LLIVLFLGCGRSGPKTESDSTRSTLEEHLKKLGSMLLPLALLLLLTSLRLHAQVDGCDDSPENPTLVLGLIVGAAGLAFPRVRHYLRSRNNARRR
jgi:XrtJ-associated TM-motif-TM protein